MHDPEKPGSAPGMSTDEPSDAPITAPSGFDPLTGLHRAMWVINPRGVMRTGGSAAPIAQPDIDSVERRPFTEDGTRLIRRATEVRNDQVAHAQSAQPLSDGLTLDRLYMRFNAIARGWVHGDSAAAHLSIVERLASNQAHAAGLGWTNFLITRRGGSGRLELQGSRSPGQDRELVPDQIPYR